MVSKKNEYEQITLHDSFLFGLTDREKKVLEKSWAKIFADEIVENLMLDLHLQYALHTTGFQEQPLSDKSLSRFRKRCYEYENTHGVDLHVHP